MVFSYSAVTNRARATLPSVSEWGTSTQVTRDPPRSVYTRKIERVGSEISDELIASGDRHSEVIRPYGRAQNVMPVVGSVVTSKYTGGLDEYATHRLMNGGAFRPPPATMDAPLSRLPYGVISVEPRPSQGDAEKELTSVPRGGPTKANVQRPVMTVEPSLRIPYGVPGAAVASVPMAGRLSYSTPATVRTAWGPEMMAPSVGPVTGRVAYSTPVTLRIPYAEPVSVVAHGGTRSVVHSTVSTRRASTTDTAVSGDARARNALEVTGSTSLQTPFVDSGWAQTEPRAPQHAPIVVHSTASTSRSSDLGVSAAVVGAKISTSTTGVLTGGGPGGGPEGGLDGSPDGQVVRARSSTIVATAPTSRILFSEEPGASRVVAPRSQATVAGRVAVGELSLEDSPAVRTHRSVTIPAHTVVAIPYAPETTRLTEPGPRNRTHIALETGGSKRDTVSVEVEPSFRLGVSRVETSTTTGVAFGEEPGHGGHGGHGGHTRASQLPVDGRSTITDHGHDTFDVQSGRLVGKPVVSVAVARGGAPHAPDSAIQPRSRRPLDTAIDPRLALTTLTEPAYSHPAIRSHQPEVVAVGRPTPVDPSGDPNGDRNGDLNGKPELATRPIVSVDSTRSTLTTDTYPLLIQLPPRLEVAVGGRTTGAAGAAGRDNAQARRPLLDHSEHTTAKTATSGSTAMPTPTLRTSQPAPSVTSHRNVHEVATSQSSESTSSMSRRGTDRPSVVSVSSSTATPDSHRAQITTGHHTATPSDISASQTNTGVGSEHVPVVRLVSHNIAVVANSQRGLAERDTGVAVPQHHRKPRPAVTRSTHRETTTGTAETGPSIVRLPRPAVTVAGVVTGAVTGAVTTAVPGDVSRHTSNRQGVFDVGSTTHAVGAVSVEDRGARLPPRTVVVGPEQARPAVDGAEPRREVVLADRRETESYDTSRSSGGQRPLGL